MRQLTIIWAALVGGVVLYTALIGGMLATGRLALSIFDPSLMNYVGACAIVLMMVAVFARRTMLARIPRDAPPEERLQRYTGATIIALAMLESGGLLVITLGMLSGSATWVFAGGAAAAGTMFMARPTASEIGLD